jgi:hypothetical protein
MQCDTIFIIVIVITITLVLGLILISPIQCYDSYR